MDIQEALHVANDVRNGCRNVNEVEAILVLASAIDALRCERNRNVLLGCEDGKHEDFSFQYYDGSTVTFCSKCGMNWPYDSSARKRMMDWNSQILQGDIARRIANYSAADSGAGG